MAAHTHKSTRPSIHTDPHTPITYTTLHSLGIVCPRFHNPADFFINQISIVPTKQEASMARLQMLWDAYEGSALCSQNLAWRKEMPEAVLRAKHKPVSMKHFHASTWTQFYYTMQRNIQNEFRRVLDVKARFVNAIVMGLILGIIYYGQVCTNGCSKERELDHVMDP